MALEEQKCRPCHSETTPFSAHQSEKMLERVPTWTLDDKMIRREFAFKDFREAMGFVNKVSDLAQEQDHHPDIHISYNKVRLELTTHKIGGLSENDFILAAKIDRLV